MDVINLSFRDQKTDFTMVNDKFYVINEISNSCINFMIDGDVKIAIINLGTSGDSDVTFTFKSEGSRILINHLALIKDKNMCSNKISIVHNFKETYSNYKFMGFAIDESNLRISAKSYIEKGMSNSEAHQRIKIITDGNARGVGEPGLFIDDNDVKASHGNSIGQLDDSAVYYLQSKGIQKDIAKWIIIEAQINKMLIFMADDIKVDILNSIKNMLGIEYEY